jgi:hypothetical protein
MVGMDNLTANFRVVFDPNRYSQRVLALILDKAEQWHCTPLEAEVRLLDELAQAQLQDKEDAA